MASEKQISMAASAIAMRGVRLFLSARRNAAERRALPPSEPKRPKKPVVPGARPPQKIFDLLTKTTKFNKGFYFVPCLSPALAESSIIPSPPLSSVEAARLDTNEMPNKKLKEKTLETLYRSTHFSKHELEALYAMYRRLVTAAQGILPPSAIGQPPAKVDGIDQGTFRDVMHNTFDMITEEAILERIWVTWERGAGGGEGAIRLEPWVRGLSVLLRGSDEERLRHCFAVYDLNTDGYITRDEMFVLLKNSLLKQPGDEDPDEGVRELVELVLRKMDVDKDGRVSPEDYKLTVEQEPLLLEAFGQCLPSRRHATAFLKTLNLKKES